MNRRGWAAALAGGALLTAAGTARAALVTEAGSPYPTGGTAPYAINVADFNGDGLPDVATINGDGQTLSLFLRHAGGFALETGQPYPLNAIPSNAAVGDFDDNGLQDLAVGIFGGNFSVELMLRQATGGFTAQPVAGASGVTAIATGQFNADTQLDLAVARQGSNAVSILLAQRGTFVEGPPIATGAGPASLAVGDFNRDGVADLAVGNKAGNSVTAMLGSGDGAFAAQPPVPVGVEPGGIVAADFTGDGRSDFAVTNFTDGTVSVFDATDTGFVQEPGSPITVTSRPVGLALADVNGDGRADLAVAANGPGDPQPGAIDILVRGANSFTRDSAIPVAGRQNAVAAGDFDRDGRPDLAFSEITNSTFSVLLNPAPTGPTPTPTPTPTPSPTPTPLPPPVAGKTVNAARKSGTVRLRRPGSDTFVTLAADAQIPVGSVVDTRHGRIAITAAQGGGRTASADFFAGLFKLTQTKGAKPATTLTLTEKLSCPKRRQASAAAKRKKSRRLWGQGHGRFTTKGSYSAATVRGTKWLVQDTCDSTTTTVASGVVSVRDRVKRRTVILRAGRRYVAHRRR